jgi:hypothetical protein
LPPLLVASQYDPAARPADKLAAAFGPPRAFGSVVDAVTDIVRTRLSEPSIR